jgi:DNA-binding beta-propeller fold protein YncE
MAARIKTILLLPRWIVRIAACLFCLAQAAHADFLVSSQSNGAVMQYNEATESFVGKFASVTIPTGIAVRNGYVFVNDYLGGYTYKFDESTGTQVGTVGGGGQYPSSLAFGSTGDMFVGTIGFYSAGQGAVYKYTSPNLQPTGTMFVPPHSNEMDLPEAITVGPDGSLLVASSFSSAVLRFNAVTGAFLNTMIPAGSGGLSGANGLAFGANGNLFVSSYFNNQVLEYDGHSGNILGVFASGSQLDGPVGLAFGPDGNLYVVSNRNNSVLRYDGLTGAYIDTVVASDSGTLQSPVGIVFVPEPASFWLFAAGGIVMLLRYKLKCSVESRMRDYCPET